jgi:hypothetical protein
MFRTKATQKINTYSEYIFPVSPEIIKQREEMRTQFYAIRPFRHFFSPSVITTRVSYKMTRLKYTIQIPCSCPSHSRCERVKTEG